MTLFPTTHRRGSLFGWMALGLPLLMALIAQAAPVLQKPSAGKSVPTKPSQTTPIQTKLRYNRDIRPILAENCFACHGPDSAARKAGLRLDKFADATTDRGGHAPIVKGKP